jgi:hypothetical protein
MRAGMPTPRAAVADNDLAVGRVVEAVTRSRFWPKTAIFIVEDDPQAGFDHIDGHRTVALVVSPYTPRGAVDSTNYNQTSMIRTMELILGLPPMNQFDASASAMASCFAAEANLAPYRAVKNIVPLDELNPEVEAKFPPRCRWTTSTKPTRTRSTASCGTPCAAATTPIPPGPCWPKTRRKKIARKRNGASENSHENAQRRDPDL